MGLGNERAPQSQALPLTARERRRKTSFESFELQLGEHFAHTFGNIGFFFEFKGQGQIASHCKPREKRKILPNDRVDGFAGTL